MLNSHVKNVSTLDVRTLNVSGRTQSRLAAAKSQFEAPFRRLLLARGRDKRRRSRPIVRRLAIYLRRGSLLRPQHSFLRVRISSSPAQKTGQDSESTLPVMLSFTPRRKTIGRDESGLAPIATLQLSLSF